MRKFLKDREHLARMAGLFSVGLILFLIARTVLVPKDFHELGHFRTGALADNMAQPMAFAGREACESCHPDMVWCPRAQSNKRRATLATTPRSERSSTRSVSARMREARTRMTARAAFGCVSTKVKT